jgi:hypothetical protein
MSGEGGAVQRHLGVNDLPITTSGLMVTDAAAMMWVVPSVQSDLDPAMIDKWGGYGRYRPTPA